MEVSVETLAHGTKVCISRAHRFGTDAMLLSGFARPRRAEQASPDGFDVPPEEAFVYRYPPYKSNGIKSRG